MDEQLSAFLRSMLAKREREKPTGQDDVMDLKRLKPVYAAAAKLGGKPLYPRMQVAGSTALFRGGDWMLEPLASQHLTPANAGGAPAIGAIAAAFALPPGSYVLPEEGKGEPIMRKHAVATASGDGRKRQR